MRLRGTALFLAALGTLPTLVSFPRPAGAQPAPRADRVLILSLPYVSWDDLGTGATPQLDALLDEAAVGNLAARAARRRTTPGDGYATIGAGTRAGAPAEEDGLALAPGETFEGGTAAEAYRRRTGRSLEGAAAGHLNVALYHSENDRLLFDGEAGALGEALDEAGIGAAVIGNADLAVRGTQPAGFGRQAVAALMTPDGRVGGGRVDRGLLRADPEAPYGHRLDRAAVVDAFDAAWRDRAVVLVEASDLVRAESYGDVLSAPRRREMERRALAWTDEMVGDLRSRLDPRRDAVLVVAPATPRGEIRLTVVAVAAPGGRPSLLRSASTRRSGFVTIFDVGPTVLDLLGQSRPGSMEGRPMEGGRTGGDAADRRAFLIDTERDARFRDRIVAPVAFGFVVAQVVLSGLAVLALRRGHGRARVAVEVAALTLLGTLPLTYLAGLLPFSEAGVAAYLAFVLVGALVLALLARTSGGAPARDQGASGATRRPHDLWPVGIVLATVLGVISASALLGSRLQLSTVFGDSPIVAGRFTGINNLTFAQLVTAALILAAFLGHRLGGRRGALAGIAVLAGALLVDGSPAWGADIGGVLSAAPAFLLVGSLLLGLRVGARTAVLGAGVTAAALGLFAVVDLSRPSTRRSHLGRLFEQVDEGGWGAFATVIERKLNANLSVLTKSPWTLMVPAALAFVAYLVYRSPSALGEIQRRLPQLRVALAGIFVAAVLGFALNDSGIAVPGMMLGVLNPVLVYLSARWT